MNTQVRTLNADRWSRVLMAIAAGSALVLSLFALTSRTLASDVVPTPVNSGNPTCSDFAPEGATWTQFKLEGADLADGTYTDGVLSVTIDNFVGSDAGTPGSFDWSSNVGVDAVFVKAGTDKHNLYVYDPEATSDTGLGPQAGTGNGISHISFCYDAGESTPTPTPTQSPTATPTQTPPEVTATPTQTPEQTVAPTGTPEQTVQAATGTPAPTNSPEGGVKAATGTPAASQPDTAIGSLVGGSSAPTLLFALLLLASLGGLTYLNIGSARKDD